MFHLCDLTATFLPTFFKSTFCDAVRVKLEADVRCKCFTYSIYNDIFFYCYSKQ